MKMDKKIGNRHVQNGIPVFHFRKPLFHQLSGTIDKTSLEIRKG